MFEDRIEAGRKLAGALSGYRGRSDVVVLGLPRGGVPVAAEVARAVGAPLDVFVVRKLGVPYQPELAFGALSSGGTCVFNDDVLRQAHLSEDQVQQVVAAETAELHRREEAYRGERPPVPLEGQVVIVVDDGLATGASMRAAVRGLRQRAPSQVVVAIPVAPAVTCHALEEEADKVVCLQTPEWFRSVGEHYLDFAATTDDEVRHLLQATP